MKIRETISNGKKTAAALTATAIMATTANLAAQETAKPIGVSAGVDQGLALMDGNKTPYTILGQFFDYTPKALTFSLNLKEKLNYAANDRTFALWIMPEVSKSLNNGQFIGAGQETDINFYQQGKKSYTLGVYPYYGRSIGKGWSAMVLTEPMLDIENGSKTFITFSMADFIKQLNDKTSISFMAIPYSVKPEGDKTHWGVQARVSLKVKITDITFKHNKSKKNNKRFNQNTSYIPRSNIL